MRRTDILMVVVERKGRLTPYPFIHSAMTGPSQGDVSMYSRIEGKEKFVLAQTKKDELNERLNETTWKTNCPHTELSSRTVV